MRNSVAPPCILRLIQCAEKSSPRNLPGIQALVISRSQNALKYLLRGTVPAEMRDQRPVRDMARPCCT